MPPGAKEAFIAPDLSSGPTFIKSGYQFSLAGTGVAGSPASCNGLGVGQAAAGYAVVADSLDTSAGARFFGTNTEGVIYEHTVSMAMTMPETGAPAGGVPIK